MEHDEDEVTLNADISADDAAEEITKAVSARHKIARNYVSRQIARHPDASPEEIVELLERHYVRAITVAGGAMAAGAMAANVGLALIPGVAAGKEVGKAGAKAGAKVAARSVAKKAAKQMALNAAKTGAGQVIPAGDAQVQFEITAIFALAVAELHEMTLDQDQAHALVYGLSNGKVSQGQIATMAADVAETQGAGMGQGDWSNWANTLAETLPGGAARDLVRTVQTGHLDTVRAGLTGKEQAAIEYGVGALTGGVTRFVFGREVVEAARDAFAAPPADFPARLLAHAQAKADEMAEPSKALAALEDAARSTGSWVSSTADQASRPFRRVDRDGDGIPDEPQALSAAKGAGQAISDATAASTRAFRRVDRDGDGIPDDSQVRTAARGLRDGVASKLRRGSKDEGDSEPASEPDVD